MALNLPPESWGEIDYESYEVQLHYSNEQDVYDTTGFHSPFIQKIGQEMINGTMTPMTADQVSTMINGYIAKADGEIRRRLGIPYIIRKEGHEFFNNPWVQLGPDREDIYEFQGAYEPTNKVLGVYTIWYNQDYKIKTCYPKNVVQFTEPSAGNFWSATGNSLGVDGATVESVSDREHTIIGTGSIHATITDPQGGSITYPSNQNLNLRVYPWFYSGFMFMTDTPNAVFRFAMVRDTGSYFYGEFTINGQVSTYSQPFVYSGFGYLPMTFVPMSLNVRLFRFANLGGETSVPDFNWILIPTQRLMIMADRPCQFWIAGINFNDGFFASAPQGYIYWSMPMWYPTGRIEVTYSYDPYINKIPEPLNEASRKWAGVKLMDWLIGKRQMAIAFDELSDTLEENPDKETLQATRRVMRQEGLDALASIGYGTFEGGSF